MDYLSDYYAFSSGKLVASGKLVDIALSLKGYEKQNDIATFLLFNGTSGQEIDIDLTGSDAEVVARFQVENIPGLKTTNADAAETPKRGRGRPKLGVEGREITLLPRHWQWLETQRGGASATIRRLIDAERKESTEIDKKKHAQDAANRFMYAIGGDLSGFEEAIRALYAGDGARFSEETDNWPTDIRDCARMFAAPAFD
ncbi:MAG: DUF2239 family protein [Pseudomonadales bacterium]|nr:DUF2239 family protein [Pseudomonadales bacterium]